MVFSNEQQQLAHELFKEERVQKAWNSRQLLARMKRSEIRGNAIRATPVIARSEATKQSTTPCAAPWIASLRSQ